ncbi:MAG TPA: hypothetical protein PKD37_00265 [Oligoflexia bacterium]|nr:hypothetical protein [Oligoflexia bacterium]HMP26414.1 hypothetical protein [Oligoflexia bacterium]
MARGFYNTEFNDPDLKWLIESFCDNKGECIIVAGAQQPIVLLPLNQSKTAQLIGSSNSIDKNPQINNNAKQIKSNNHNC